jgi:hypothetical protein
MQYRNLVFAMIMVMSMTESVKPTSPRKRRTGKWGWNNSWNNKSCTNASGLVVTKGNGFASASANDKGVKTFAKGSKGALSKTNYSNVTDACGKSNNWQANKNGKSVNSRKWRKNESTAGKTIAAARGNATVGSKNGQNGASSHAKGKYGGIAGSAHQKRKDNWAVNEGCTVDRRNGRAYGYKNKFLEKKNAKSKSSARFMGKGEACTSANENGTSFFAKGKRGSGGRAAHDITEKSTGVTDDYYMDKRGRKRSNKKTWGKHQSSKAKLQTCVDGEGFTAGKTDQDKGLSTISRGKRGTKTRFGLSTKRNNWGTNKGFEVNPEKCGYGGVGAVEGRRLSWGQRPICCKKALKIIKNKLCKCRKISKQKTATIKTLKAKLGKCRNRNMRMRKQIQSLINKNKCLRVKLNKCRRTKRKCGRKPVKRCKKKPVRKPCGCNKRRNKEELGASWFDW